MLIVIWTVQTDVIKGSSLTVVDDLITKQETTTQTKVQKTQKPWCPCKWNRAAGMRLTAALYRPIDLLYTTPPSHQSGCIVKRRYSPFHCIFMAIWQVTETNAPLIHIRNDWYIINIFLIFFLLHIIRRMMWCKLMINLMIMCDGEDTLRDLCD